MSSTVDRSLGDLISEARTARSLSLHEVADQAGCSTAYVHKLEQDRVRTPSPRVLAGLARALGLDYAVVMRASGYDAPPSRPTERLPVTAPRFSNAHIVELLETLVGEVTELRRRVDQLASKA